MHEIEEEQEAVALEELRVLLVDDHDLFRSGLRNLLEERGVQVVGEAATGAEALRIVRENPPELPVVEPAVLEPPEERRTGRTDKQAESDGVTPGKRATVPSWDEILLGTRPPDH